MPTLQQTIAEKFLSSLAAGDDVSAEQIEQLRVLLEHGKKPKAEDFVKVFIEQDGGDVK